jgi:hypothetical protein
VIEGEYSKLLFLSNRIPYDRVVGIDGILGETVEGINGRN